MKTMKQSIKLFIPVFLVAIHAFSQQIIDSDLKVNGSVSANEYKFDFSNYNFTLAPRLQSSPMSIKLFNDTNTGRILLPGDTNSSNAPERNAWGTLLALRNDANFYETNIYFGGPTKRMYYRTSSKTTSTSDSGIAGGWNEWRTILDSKNNIISSGVLQLSGVDNHYFKNGNVGIGTIKPKSKFQIGTRWAFHDGATEKIMGYNFYIDSITGVSKRLTSDEVATMRFNYNGDMSFETSVSGLKDSTITSWTNGLIIKNNGNIGIGTATPKQKFQIGDRWTFQDGAHKVIGYNYNFDLGIDKRIAQDEVAVMRFTDAGDIRFETSGTGNAGSAVAFTNNVLVIKNNGNVAIGTDNTTDNTVNYKLSVNGFVRATEVKVYTNWADFVFEKNYNLPTLKEVESYIVENGHLKDIPSTKEVQENGVQLGEMNKLLLQKIEELTLYIIQLKKEVDDLKLKVDTKK